MMEQILHGWYWYLGNNEYNNNNKKHMINWVWL